MLWTEYQGFKVVETDKVLARHPRNAYENMNPMKDATLLLLEDGIMLVVCDTLDANGVPCGFNGITFKLPYATPIGEQKSVMDQSDSLLAHKSGTHYRKLPSNSPYSDNVLRFAIRTFLKWKATHRQNWTTEAMNEMASYGFVAKKPWTTESFGGMVRHYMKQPRFLDVKAGPMDEQDQSALAELIRRSANTVGSSNTLANIARITEAKNKPVPHKHTPIDWGVVASPPFSGTPAKPEKKKEPELPTPNLVFVAEKAEKTMSIEVSKTPTPTPSTAFREAAARQQQERPAPTVTVSSATHAPAEVVVPKFQRLQTLKDGSFLFLYEGELMVAKPVTEVIS